MHPASFRLREEQSHSSSLSAIKSKGAKTSKPVNFIPRQHLREAHNYCALREGALEQQEANATVLSCEGKGFEFKKLIHFNYCWRKERLAEHSLLDIRLNNG